MGGLTGAGLDIALLTGRAWPQARLGSGHEREDITYQGIAGLELEATGQAALAVTTGLRSSRQTRPVLRR